MTDRCAQCFAELRPAPGGMGRLACLHPRFVLNKRREVRVKMVSMGYLSEAVPEAPHTREACVESRRGRPTLHAYWASVPT